MSVGTAEVRIERPSARSRQGSNGTRYLVPLGRAAFAVGFFVFSPLVSLQQSIPYAAQQGVPLPQLLVPLSGLISLAGALSVLLGYRARIGAWLLILFLVPVTFFMHNFWTIEDPMMAQWQLGAFMGNLSRVGAALIIAHFGAGPVSLDERARVRKAI
jgi:putative oxidoreductase